MSYIGRYRKWNEILNINTEEITPHSILITARMRVSLNYVLESNIPYETNLLNELSLHNLWIIFITPAEPILMRHVLFVLKVTRLLQ
jgi:hypothetical protein